jgi:predicted DNA-binding transcriptional regulator YafY
MAKDTEKLIRQLSLISYLMAERRPVTALDIKRDVEGYSGMNEDAFARRFYADRAELESLRIPLTVEKPLDGVAEQENYSLRWTASSPTPSRCGSRSSRSRGDGRAR